MYEKAESSILVLLMLSFLFIFVRVQVAISESAVIVVPDDYPTIAGALAASNAGDTIFVRRGVYNESGLVINKPLSIIGEGKTTTVVDGRYLGSVLMITSTSNVTIEGFAIKNGSGGCIYLGQANNITVSNNDISGSDGRGFMAYEAHSCVIRDNSVEDCSLGMSVASSSDITISRNNIAYCETFCLFCSASNNVRVYYNNIADLNARIDNSVILCDNGYPSGGNYWAGYSGTDANGDGIGDAPCHPDPGHPLIEDRYPLMNPFPCIHDVAVVSLNVEPPIFNKGRIVPVSVRVANLGHFSQVFNTTIYANSTIIEEIVNSTLEGEEFREIQSTWNTTSFDGGDYTIWAKSQTVQGETDTSNNEFTFGIVSIVDIQILETIPCNQIGDPCVSFNRGETAYFKTTIVVVSHSTPIVFSSSLFDEALRPIGLASFRGPVVPGNTTFLLGIPIPEWATLGKATVYSDIFTDWPHSGGIPLCFEIQANFTVANNLKNLDSFSTTGYTMPRAKDYSSILDLGRIDQLSIFDTNLTLSTDRVSYYPAQTIYVAGGITNEGRPLRFQPTAFEVVDPQGSTIVARILLSNDLGHFNMIFSLPIGATLGNYTIYATSSYSGGFAADEIVFQLKILAGDLNIDGKVNILDIVIVARAFGARPNDNNWDARADVAAAYGIINIVDLAVVAIHFGDRV